VLVATKRARQIAMGAEPLVELDNDIDETNDDFNMMPAAISENEIMQDI